MNASGALCTSRTELESLSMSDSAAIVTKSATLCAREGNPTPRYWGNPSFSINSMGIPNLGYAEYEEYSRTIVRNKPYIMSISGIEFKDNLTMLAGLHESESIDGIELNVSCPNIVGKPQLGYDLGEEGLENCLRSVAEVYEKPKHCVLGLKLPPYFDFNHFTTVADILIENGHFDFITCCNSLGNGLVVDIDKECSVIKPKNGFGGIGGVGLKSTALANVHKFYKLFKYDEVDIIGCGGIMTGRDVFEYILCGAKAVQVGTYLIENENANKCDIFKQLNAQVIDIMNAKSYKTIESFRGKLKYLS